MPSDALVQRTIRLYLLAVDRHDRIGALWLLMRLKRWGAI